MLRKCADMQDVNAQAENETIDAVGAMSRVYRVYESLSL